MGIGKTIAKFFGNVFLGLNFLAFFFIFAILLTPYELDELHKKINAQYPDKIVNLLDLLAPEINQITLENISTLCIARNFINVPNITESNDPFYDYLFFNERDLDLICENVNKVQNIVELKKMLISAKLEKITSEIFTKIETEYDQIYLLFISILVVASIVFHLISFGLFYFTEGGLSPALRAWMFWSFIYTLVYVVVLGIAWFILPFQIAQITETIKIQNNLTIEGYGMSDPQKQLISVFVLDAVNFVTNWMREAITHFIAIYIIAAFILGANWFFYLKTRQQEPTK